MTTREAVKAIIAERGHEPFSHADVCRLMGREVSRTAVSNAAAYHGCVGTVGAAGGYRRVRGFIRGGSHEVDESALYDPEYVELQLIFWPGKTCPRCGRKLPANGDYFAADRYRRDGLTCQCRACRRDMGQERYAADPAIRERKRRRERERRAAARRAES